MSAALKSPSPCSSRPRLNRAIASSFGSVESARLPSLGEAAAAAFVVVAGAAPGAGACALATCTRASVTRRRPIVIVVAFVVFMRPHQGMSVSRLLPVPDFLGAAEGAGAGGVAEPVDGGPG